MSFKPSTKASKVPDQSPTQYCFSTSLQAPHYPPPPAYPIHHRENSLSEDAHVVEQHHGRVAEGGLQLEHRVQALLLRLDQFLLRQGDDELDGRVRGVLLEVAAGTQGGGQGAVQPGGGEIREASKDLCREGCGGKKD